MNNNKVQVWLYDTNNNNKLTDTVLVDKGTTLGPGQTFVQPKDGLFGVPKFNADQQDWFGENKDDWLRSKPYNGDNSNQPSTQQQLMADLMKANADLQKQVNMQATINATIMNSIAELKSKVK